MVVDCVADATIQLKTFALGDRSTGILVIRKPNTEINWVVICFVFCTRLSDAGLIDGAVLEALVL